MNNENRILIVDDDKTICKNLKLVLDNDGYDVVAVDKGALAIEQVKERFFNVVLLDLMLSDANGIELLQDFRRRSPETCFIIFTGYASIPSAIEALKAGAHDYIIKPFDIDYLKLMIKRGIEKQKLVFNNRSLLEYLEKEKQKLGIILQVNRQIGGILNLEELTDFVAEMAVKIAEAEKASLMIIDESAGELVLKGSKGLDKEKINWRVKIGKLISGWVAQEGEALLVTDIDSDPRFKTYAKEARYRTKSFVSLPLKIDTRIIGVMNVTDKIAKTEIFTQDDLRYLSLVAHQTVMQIESIRLYEKLSSLVIEDSLTNIFNHRHFQEQLQLEILRVQRYKHPLSLIMFDVDFFKAYNDNHGHLEGDRVLKSFAATMKKYSRKVDIVSRYGGEEFMIILPDTDTQGAMIVAEKIKEATRAIGITVSGGVASYKVDMSKDDLVSCVDQALYKAKSQGRNRVCVFE